MAEIVVEKTKIDKVEEMYKDGNKADRIRQYFIYDYIPCISGGQYNIGDEVLYLSADCVLPDKLVEAFDLKDIKKNRLRPIKIWGYRSLGLILPIKEVEEIMGVSCDSETLIEALGIKKYEQPITTRGGHSSFGGPGWGIPCPPWMPEYNCVEQYFRYKKLFTNTDKVIITEKLHGMNTRFGMNLIDLDENDGLPVLYVGSHSVVRKMDERDFFWQTAIKYDIRNKLYKLLLRQNAKFGTKTIVLYCERYGKNDNGSDIQHLTYEYEDTQLAVFDMMLDLEFLDFFHMADEITYVGLDVPHVLYVGIYDHEIILQLKNGQSSYCDQIKEGVVVRILKEELRSGKRLILKAIGDEYYFDKHGKIKTEFKE